MSPAGYSGKSFIEKIALRPSMVVGLLNAPNDIKKDIKAVATIAQESPFDIYLAFFSQESELMAVAQDLPDLIQKNGSIWVAWPKKASRVTTDLTEQTFRDILLPTGLVDNKVCSIDEKWSGLRFVWRKELR